MMLREISEQALQTTKEKHQEWLASRKTKGQKADFSHADLTGVKLEGIQLQEADLNGADLSGVDLSGADLSGADLAGANFRRSYLQEANLSNTKLNGANLSGADLSGADLSGADLSESQLERAIYSLETKLPSPGFDPKHYQMILKGGESRGPALEANDSYLKQFKNPEVVRKIINQGVQEGLDYLQLLKDKGIKTDEDLVDFYENNNNLLLDDSSPVSRNKK